MMSRCARPVFQSWRVSLLGHVLLIIFENDLEIDIVNSVFKFADDAKLLGKVYSSNSRNHSSKGACDSTVELVRHLGNAIQYIQI